MVVKVYYSEISGSKEVKKRQQRVMMILDSKCIPYEAIDITEPGKESAKDFMLSNAKPRGDTKVILSPQIFSDDLYCGDYDDFDLANENDVLEKFLNSPKIERNVPAAAAPVSTTNGSVGSREPSVEATAAPTNGTNDNENNEAEQQEEPTQSEAPTESASSEPAAVDSTTSEPQEEAGIDQEEEEVDE